jgi:peptide/nickel transport system permease protein
VIAVAVVVLKRSLLGFLTLFVVSAFISVAIQVLPGDFCQSLLGQAATADTVQACRKDVGLDRGPIQRYVEWLEGVAHGDFGYSLAGAGSFGAARRSVADLIAPRLRNTLFLAGTTAAIAVPGALMLGMLAALYRGGISDRLVNVITLTSISLPEFLVAYILMLFLSVKIPVFPALASVSPDMPLPERALHIALPVLTLTVVVLAYMMRMTRAAIINVLSNPYIEMARLKGLSPRRIVVHHALPNAWAPIANVVAMTLAYLVVGVVVVETVFSYPGIGKLMVDAVRFRNMPVVNGCALIFAATYILLNLAADIIAIVTNPRMLYPR